MRNQLRTTLSQGEASRYLYLCVIPVLALLIGCGPKTDLLGVTGEIILNGEPLKDGSIRFTTDDDGKLMTSGAVIREGEYKIPRDKGLREGVYRVVINSPDTEAKPVMVRMKPDQPPIPLPPERIPPEYNVKSQQTVEVSRDGDNHFVFDIGS